MRISKAEIILSKSLLHDYHLLEVKVDNRENMGIPGQFYEIEVTPYKLRVPISIHYITADSIVFMVKTVGEKSNWLSQRKKGEVVNILGPLGNGFDVNVLHEKRLLFVSGGVGFAPLYFLYKLLPKSYIAWCHGARYGKELTVLESYQQEISKLSLCSDDGVLGLKGNVLDGLTAYFSENPPDEVDYVIACGPVPMLRALQVRCTQLGIPLIVSLEAYMACGVGVCYGCAVKVKGEGYARVCKDGPVFDSGEVIWE